MKLISKLALLLAFHQSSAVDTGVQQLRGGEEDTFQQQLLGLKEGVPPERNHDLSPGWQKNPSERQGEGHAGRRSHARKGRSNATPRPERKVQPLTTTSSSLAPQYCTQPEGGCILRYNNRTWNENGSECEGRCYCNYVNEKNRARNGGQPAFMCSKSPGDDVNLPEDDEGAVPEELSETATAATPTTTKASKEDRVAEKAARKAERETNRGSKSTKSPSMEREKDELTETATTAAPTTTKASKEEAKEARKAEKAARKAEREANRGSKSTKSPSAFGETEFAIA